MNSKEVKKNISRLKVLGLEKSSIRLALIDYIKKYPMTGRKKSILLGWGDRNFTARINQHIPDNKLIECVEKLMGDDGKTN